MKVHVTREYETSDGKRHKNRRRAKSHERRLKLDAERVADRKRIKRTAGGNWSIPCQQCDQRHVQPYSNDYVWCPECQKACAEDFGGHEPDDDNPAECFRCGGRIEQVLQEAV